MALVPLHSAHAFITVRICVYNGLLDVWCNIYYILFIIPYYIQGLCRLGLELGCRNTADKTQFTLQTNQNFRMLETLTGRK